MARHSKNNTASGVFTYSERQMTGYGTKRKRLGGESKRKFDSCYLCLETARQPVVCKRGHLSCRECALQCILDQKLQIQNAAKREEDDQRRQQQEAETEKSREMDGKRVRLLEGEVGLKSAQLVKRTTTESHFWTPSKTPPSTKKPTRAVKRSVECLASTPAHQLRPKDLINVCFSDSKLCPSCDRPFGSEIQVIVGCGHVLCGRCVGNFVEPVGLCFVCQKPAKKRVELVTEGTGFTAGGGKMVATSYDHALQA